MKNLIKLFTMAFLVAAAISPIYAFAFSDPATEASGEGASTISGWTISNVQYQLANGSANIQGVRFDLDAPAEAVSVKLSSKSALYTSCTHVTGYQWQCDFPAGVSVSSMDELHVIAVGD